MNDNSKNELARIFIGLGDENRINIIKFLGDGETKNFDEILQNFKLDANALNIHLQILIDAGLLKQEYLAKKNLYHLNINPILEIKEFADEINSNWGEALWAIMKSLDE